jgi:hypothetical protein
MHDADGSVQSWMWWFGGSGPLNDHATAAMASAPALQRSASVSSLSAYL